MNNVAMGCLAPDKWWADQKAKRRTIVLVIILCFYAYLTAVAKMSPLEAGGIFLIVGLAASTIIDRVVDGSRMNAGEIAAVHQLAEVPFGPGRQ